MDAPFPPPPPELDGLLVHHTNGVLQEVAALKALEASAPSLFFQSTHLQHIVSADKIAQVNFDRVINGVVSAHEQLAHVGFLWEVTSRTQAIQAHLQALARVLSEHAPGFGAQSEPVFALDVWGQETELRLWLRTSDWVARQALLAPHHSTPSPFTPQDLLLVCRLACKAEGAGAGDRWSFGWNLFSGRGAETASAVAQDAFSALAWMAATVDHGILFATQSGTANLVRHHPGAHDLLQTLRR